MGMYEYGDYFGLYNEEIDNTSLEEKSLNEIEDHEDAIIAFNRSWKVYEWKYMNCLQLWTGTICTYGSVADIKPLAYPLTQIISGVVRLVPTARYLPLRLSCIMMQNQIAAATNTFIPVVVLLTDMLDMKELNKPPTGGVGKAVDLHAILRVSKATIKTRSFQEACVFYVIEELAEHLSQWSYSPAFFELSFVPAVRLRNFCKSTKVERFCREMRQLIREDDKKKGSSPLSTYVATLRQKAQQRSDSLVESSVIVGEKASIFGKKRANRGDDDDDDDDGDNDNDDLDVDVDVDGAAIFNSSWLPSGDYIAKNLEENKKGKKQSKNVAGDEDVVQDFVLSSDEEESMSDEDMNESEDAKVKSVPLKQGKQKQKAFEKSSKRKGNFHAKNKSRKRTKAN